MDRNIENLKAGESGYNSRKLQVLTFLSRSESWVRPEQLALTLGVRVQSLRGFYSYMRRLWGWRLLWRKENPVRYRISQHGRKRLIWLLRKEGLQ